MASGYGDWQSRFQLKAVAIPFKTDFDTVSVLRDERIRDR